MKKNIFIFWLFFVGCYSVPTLDQKEILKSTNDTFMPSQLKMAYEVEGLRLDIIRQTSNRSREMNISYHPLGFDLGNGLFYDMNQNLSLRLDKLLGINDWEDYSIKKEYSNPSQTTISRKRDNGKFCEKGKSREGNIYEECSKLIKNNNVFNYYWREKEKLLYSIEQRENTFLYFKSGLSKPDLIMTEKKGNEFRVGNTKVYNEFILENQTLHLGEKYIIRQNKERTKIQVFERKKEILVMTVKKGTDQIFIYNKNWRGLKIILKENKKEIEVYKNNKQWFLMKRE